MIITLNPDWRIRSDPLQWIVDQRHVRKPGEPDEYEEWVVWGYFSTLADAVMNVLESQVRSIEGNYPWTALEPLLGEISAMRERVSGSFKEFTFEIYANRAKSRAKVNQRGARKKVATPSWLTDEQSQEIISIYEKAARLSISTGMKYHVDHIIPLQGKDVCGLHVPWNLQPLSARENMSKSNRVDE